jgi:predicted aminopeptidase
MRIRFLPLLLLPILSGCSGVSYLVENGVGQWRMFNRARPVQDVLNSPNTSEETRQAILAVREAKEYAATFGLKATGNYETFVQLDAPCVVWAVSAAHPLELKERTWRFPIVGEVPYLGFFRKNSAEREAARIRERNDPVPDTWVRCVPAFSSLGWFADPLYSSMLKGKERDIVDLVLHESLHATVWVGGSVDFNERLASFVGLEGSLRFMQEKHGPEAVDLARREVEGERVFGEFISGEVESYRKEVASPAQKAAFYDGLPGRYLSFKEQRRADGVRFEPLKAKLDGWNNAALLAFANYYSDNSIFEAMLRACGGDLRRFVSWIVAEQKKGTGRFASAPEEHLAELVKESSCVP